VSAAAHTRAMSEKPVDPHRPERVLLVLARAENDFHGRAVRFSDASEFRFASLEELGRWLRRVTPDRASAPEGEGPRGR